MVCVILLFIFNRHKFLLYKSKTYSESNMYSPEKPTFDKEKESLKEEIDELNESNSTLTDEVARLESELDSSPEE